MGLYCTHVTGHGAGTRLDGRRSVSLSLDTWNIYSIFKDLVEHDTATGTKPRSIPESFDSFPCEGFRMSPGQRQLTSLATGTARTPDRRPYEGDGVSQHPELRGRPRVQPLKSWRQKPTARTKA